MKYLKKTLEYLKTAEFRNTIILSVIAAIVFLTYMFLIGIPATKSQNYYNKGLRALSSGDEAEALDFFIKADEYWKHSEAREYIEKLQN
jgi:hypothetical protein